MHLVAVLVIREIKHNGVSCLEQVFEKDSITSLHQLTTALSNEPTRPNGFHILEQQNLVIIASITLSGYPQFENVIAVKEDLSVCVYHKEEPVPLRTYAHITCGTISSLSKVTNLMALKIYLSIVKEKDTKATCIKSLENHLNKCDDDEEAKRLQVLLEQLKLSSLSKMGRRYVNKPNKNILNEY